MGEIGTAHEHFEHSIALHDPEQHRSLAVHIGFDPGASYRGYAAFPLWALVYPDRALKRSQEAVALAHKLSHLLSLGFVLGLGAILHMLRRDMQAIQERAEAIIALSTDQRFPVWLAAGMFARGWALAALGQSAEGIMQMRQGLAAWRTTGMGVVVPLWLVLLAEAYGRAEKAEEGLTILAEALDVMNKNGERFYEAELCRIKGELLLQQAAGSGDAAEICFRQALDIARQQQAKSLELRAAMSLSRLWQRQGKGAAARELLAPIYGWFTEGFDTADLQDAKALLAELGE